VLFASADSETSGVTVYLRAASLMLRMRFMSHCMIETFFTGPSCCSVRWRCPLIATSLS
jgi:hypothetical protein